MIIICCQNARRTILNLQILIRSVNGLKNIRSFSIFIVTWTDKIEFPLKKIKLLKGYNIEFNLSIELYTDKMFINAENIVVDGEKYILP